MLQRTVAGRRFRPHMARVGRCRSPAVHRSRDHSHEQHELEHEGRATVVAMISAAAEPPAHPGSVWRRIWSPERLPGRHIGLRAYQLGLALALLFLAHALLVNVLLWSGAMGWFLTRATGVLTVETGHSFSLWPGVVELRQLHLEVKDSNVHLELEVPKGRANILLRELLRRRFSVNGVTGEHFVLRLRPKFEQLSERRLAALPPLSEPASKSEPGAPSYLWPVRIRGLAAQYDELWLSELRYRGDARLSGGFELVPMQRVSIDPSDVALRAGSLSYGPEQRVFDLEHARVHAELQQTEVEALSRQWQERVAARVDLAGEVVDLAFAVALSPELEGLSGGRGELTLLAAAERGQWLGDFDLEYASPHVAYARGPWNAALALSLAAHGSDAPPAPDQPLAPLAASLRVRDARVSAHGEQVAQLERAQLDSKLTRAFPFGAPQGLSVDVQGLALDQLETLPKSLRPGRFQPRSVQLARTHAALTWHDGVASGSAELRFSDLSFGYGDWSVRQSGKLALEGAHWRGPGSKIRLAAAVLELDPVQIHDPKTKIDDWRLNLKLEQVACSPLAQRCTADFVASGDNAQPVLALLGVHGLPPGASDFLAMPDLRVYGSLDVTPQRQELAVDRAESKTIDVKGRLVRRDEQNRAAFLFQAAPLSLGVDVEPQDTSVKLFAGDSWLQTKLQRLTGEAPAAAR
jgi:hypothetical protein